MKLGGWQSGPKRSSRKGREEHKMIRRKKLAELVAKKREQKEEQGREGSNFEESSSRGTREAASVSDVYSDPVYREGDFVMILRDTRPGVSFTFSYDKEGKVMQVMDGEGTGPNLYIDKLLHERGSEKVDETWLMPIDYCGSVELTKRKRNKKFIPFLILDSDKKCRRIRSLLLILSVAGGATHNVKVYHSVVSCSQYQSNTISPTF